MDHLSEADLLRQVESFPFTNVTRLYRHAGQHLPETVGGGCLWMAAKLARLLRAHKPDLRVTHYDLGTPGSHLITISDDGRERLLYEPSLFQIRPFSLTHFEADPSACTSDVFPPLDPSMTLRFSHPKRSQLRVELLSPRGSVQRVFTHLLDTPVSLNEADPYVGLPFMEPQDQLFIHLLNPDGVKSILMMNTTTRHITLGRAREKLYVDTEPGFNARFERFARRLEMTEQQLRELLQGAWKIHHQNVSTLSSP
jgi:hypothetical protein